MLERISLHVEVEEEAVLRVAATSVDTHSPCLKLKRLQSLLNKSEQPLGSNFLSQGQPVLLLELPMVPAQPERIRSHSRKLLLPSLETSMSVAVV
jgi:hypothetical protein